MVKVETNLILQARDVSVFYGDKRAVVDVNLDVEREKITALIGPSGCGKTSLLRVFNRMNDLIPIAHTKGQVLFEGMDLYGPDMDPTEIRYKIGMVFSVPTRSPRAFMTTSPLNRGSTVSGATWMTLWKARCGGPPFGTRLRTG